MKAIGFVCEDCGTLITARPDSPGLLQCPNCGGGVRRHEEQVAVEATLVGVGAPAEMEPPVEDAREHPRDVFHRMVPWLGSSCVHAAGMLMLMFAIASAVPLPTAEERNLPHKIPDTTIKKDSVQAPTSPTRLRELEPSRSMFNRPKDLDRPVSPNRQPNAQNPWGKKGGEGSAGGGKEEGLARTRKIPNPSPVVFGGGKQVSILGDKDFDPKGPGGMGIFPGPDSGDPLGPEFTIGVIGDPPGGPSGQLDNVVFVIDQSGSVLSAFDQICGELRDFISYLNAPQSFHVVFFAKDTFQENPARRLMPATDGNKIEAARFLRDVRASGYGSCPIPALEAGFRALAGAKASEGKLLYLLTDGDFESSGHEYPSGGRVLRGNEAVVAWLRDHNANQAVQVNIIIVGDKPSGDTEACMRAIAKDNRGLYHYVAPK